MMFYDIINIVTGLFESIVAFMLFDNYMSRRKNFSKYIYCLGIIVLTVGINISNIIFNFTALNMLVIVVVMTMAAMMFIGDIKTRLFLSALSVAISGGAEIIVLLILSAAGNVEKADSYMNPNSRILGILLSKSLNLIIVKALCSIKGKKMLKMQTKYWVLFASIFFVVLFTIYVIFTSNSSESLSYMSVVCSVGLLCSVFAALHLYESMSRQSIELKEKELQKQQFEEQVKHLNELMIAQKQVRSIKHDLSNHMISLKSYINEKKYDESIKYIEKLIDKTQIQSDIIDTGNIVIDAIINAKRNIAKEKNIEFYTNIHIPENMEIDSSDCCVIFGNALDNAIEACEKVRGDRYIKIFLSYHDSVLSCKIINSSAQINNPLFKTTKADKVNHGIGLSNIKESLSKYKNIYRIESENNEFVFSFILFNIFQGAQ